MLSVKKVLRYALYFEIGIKVVLLGLSLANHGLLPIGLSVVDLMIA
jgi:hypothetical protein